MGKNIIIDGDTGEQPRFGSNGMENQNITIDGGAIVAVGGGGGIEERRNFAINCSSGSSAEFEKSIKVMKIAKKINEMKAEFGLAIDTAEMESQITVEQASELRNLLSELNRILML